MFPLLLGSLVSLTVVIERAIFWIRVDIRRNEPKAEEVLTLFQNRDLSGTQTITKGTRLEILHERYNCRQTDTAEPKSNQSPKDSRLKNRWKSPNPGLNRLLWLKRQCWTPPP